MKTPPPVSKLALIALFALALTTTGNAWPWDKAKKPAQPKPAVQPATAPKPVTMTPMTTLITRTPDATLP